MSSPVTVSENHRSAYAQTVGAGKHQFSADEPASLGGADSGPAPFDLLLASLGACTSMTLRMYAERKGIALKHVEVRLQHEKVEVDGKTRDQITRHITLEGELSPEQRQRMLEIANKCPVHKALSQPILIQSELI